MLPLRRNCTQLTPQALVIEDPMPSNGSAVCVRTRGWRDLTLAQERSHELDKRPFTIGPKAPPCVFARAILNDGSLTVSPGYLPLSSSTAAGRAHLEVQ